MATSATARQINEARILQALFEVGPMSRADLARKLGLTKSAMTNVIGGLLEEKKIREVESATGKTRIGRPGISIGLNPAGAHFLGVEVGLTSLRVLALDLTASAVEGGTQSEHYGEPSVEAVFDQMQRMVRRFVRDRIPPGSSIVGMCVGFPGFVSRDAVVIRAPLLGWRDVPALSHLTRRFSYAVAVENDANLSAFGEWYLHRSSARQDLLLVSLNAGAGGGLISQGRVVRGANGLAGEIGHLVVDEKRLGGFASMPMAWEEVIGTGALLSAFAQRAGRTVRLADYVGLLRNKMPAAMEVAEIWAKWLARGFLALTYAHDPERIVVGGELAPVFDLVRDQVADQMRRTSIDGFPLPTLLSSNLGSDICAFGGAALMHAVFMRAFQSDSLVDIAPAPGRSAGSTARWRPPGGAPSAIESARSKPVAERRKAY